MSLPTTEPIQCHVPPSFALVTPLEHPERKSVRAVLQQINPYRKRGAQLLGALCFGDQDCAERAFSHL